MLTAHRWETGKPVVPVQIFIMANGDPAVCH